MVLLGALSYTSITGAVYVLNEIVRLVRGLGHPLDIKFYKPAEVQQKPIAIGSADPQKVLTPDELAAIIHAAQQDILEYEAAVDGVRSLLAHVDFSEYRKPVAVDRVSRYLGLGGRPMESIQEICRTEGGMDPGAMKKTIRNRLAHVLGDALADRIVTLRNQLRQSSGLTPARKDQVRGELAELLHTVDVSGLSSFGPAKYVEGCTRYFGLEGNRVHAWKEIARRTGLDASHLRKEATEILLTLTRAPEVVRRAKELRLEVDRLHGRAIKACALQLLAVAFRRVSAPLLSLRAQPATRWITHRGTRLFGVRMRSFKMWGDEGLPEWVELPGFHGEVLERAINTAQRLTADLRSGSDEVASDCLFIVPANGGVTDRGVALTSSQLAVYFYTNVKGTDGGLVRRRNIPGGERISLHFFRHTHLTQIQEGGVGAAIAARIAGNSPQMAATAYWAMGTDVMRKQRAQSMEKGAVTGFLYDALVRTGMEATGELDDTIPAGRLSYDEAKRRLRDNPQVLQDYLQGELDPTPEAVLALLRAGGLVVNTTSKGGCMLPITAGPCPASEDCPIGCDPDRNAEDPLCGCRWQVRTADDDVIAYYESNIRTTESQLAEFTRMPGYEGLAANSNRRLRVFQAQHESLLLMRATLPARSNA